MGTNGSVSGTTKSLPGGTNYTVTAHYAGDGTNAPSDSAGVAVTVAPETTQTFIVIPTFDSSGNQLSGNATSVEYGTNYIIRVYVTDKNAFASTTGPPSPACYQENALTCPSGTVSLTANGNALDGGTFTLNNGGYTRDLTPSLTGGTYSLVAQYNGDNSYQGSKSGTAAFAVTPAPTQMTSPSVPYGPQLVGTPFTMTTNVVPYVVNGVAPTGQSHFMTAGL